MKKIVITLNSVLFMLTSQFLSADNQRASLEAEYDHPGVYVESFSLGTSASFQLNPLLNTTSYPRANLVFFANAPAAFSDDVIYSSRFGNASSINSTSYPSSIDDVTNNSVPIILSPGISAVVPLTGTTRKLSGKVCLSGSLTCQNISLDIVQHAYVSNVGGADITMASLNKNGLFDPFSVQETPGVSITEPYQIALNRTETRAYIASRADNQVFQCLLNRDQSFRACADSLNSGASFNAPSGIVLNNKNTYAYVANQNGGTTEAISVCPILPNGSFGSCVASGNTSFNFGCPNGIVLNPTGTRAYIADGCVNAVAMCPVGEDGNLGDCVDAGVGVSFNFPVGLAISLSARSVYVTNFSDSTVSQCLVNPATGLFSSCTDTGATGINGPFGISLTRSGDAAYVSSTNSNEIVRFPTQPDGSFESGVASADANLNSPLWITLD